MLRQVAFRLSECLKELRLDLPAEELFCQMHHASRVLDHLHGLNPGQFVEEPAAAGVHQHGVPLHFQQLQHGDLLFRAELVSRVLTQEAVDILG